MEGVFPTQNGYAKFHCKQNGFPKLAGFYAGQHQIVNIHDMLQCFGSSIQILSLSENDIQYVNLTTFSRFNNLEELYLRNTNIKDFDFNTIKHLNHLKHFDISQNDLKYMKNVPALSSLVGLDYFEIADNQLKNIPETIQHLSSNVKYLDLSGNFIGEINNGMFKKFTNLEWLLLEDTNLRILNLNPFNKSTKIRYLDISYNNGAHINFSLLEEILKNVDIFYAAGCDINNVIDVMKPFWSNFSKIDLSNNFVGEVNIDTFINPRFSALNLANTNLSKFEISGNWSQFVELNISYNHLQELDFKGYSHFLEIVDVQNNDLVYLANFTRSKLPKINSLAISNNNFSCQYLTEFMVIVRSVWPDLKFIGDPFIQKHGENCHRKNQPFPEESNNIGTIALYLVVSGLTTIVLISVSIFCFC